MLEPLQALSCINSAPVTRDAKLDCCFGTCAQVEAKAFPEAGGRQPTFLSGSNLQPLASNGPLPKAEAESAGRQTVIWVIFPQIQMLSGSMRGPKPDVKGPARPPRAFAVGAAALA